MILTLTPNPCNDKTWFVERFCYGGMNRIKGQKLDYSGKGFNVARALMRLGNAQVVASGFLYEENGHDTEKSLAGEGVQVDCLWRPGAVRTNTKLFDREKGVVTEFNEAGVPASGADQKALMEKFVSLAEKSRFLVLSGSLPPGCPDDFYAQIMARCQGFDCQVLLDAEGEKLSLGLAQKPALIKPNLFELESVFGRSIRGMDEAAECCETLIDRGVGMVLLSLGGDGAYFTNGRDRFFAGPVEGIAVQGTVGAGDCMIAGALTAWQAGQDAREIFRYSVAAATACVVQPGSELLTRALFDEFLPQVQIEERSL